MKTKLTLIVFTLLSINSYAQWQQTTWANTAGKVLSISSKGNLIFAGTDTAGIFVTTDKGVTWTQKNNGLTNKNSVVAIINHGNDVFAGVKESFSDAAVFRSTDNGENWTATNISFLYLFSLASTPSYLIAGTWYGVQVSTDNGDNWSSHSNGLPSNAGVSAIDFENSTIFCGVSGSSSGGTGIFRSTTNGTSWTSFNSGSTSSAMVFELAVIDTLVFAGTFGGVMVSNTSAPDWKSANSGLTSSSINSLYKVENNLFAGTNDGIFLTVNKGTDWTNVSTGLPGNTKINAITTDGSDLFIGTDSMVWRRPLSEMGIVLSSENLSLLKPKMEIYPNPFNSSTTIEFNSSLKNAELNIYNFQGKKVKTIKNISESNIVIDRDNLSEGFYFIYLTQDNQIISGSKIVIKD